jgi:excisionase family DNA binding protein
MSAPAQTSKFLTIREVAIMLGVHYTTVMKAVNAGEMRAVKIGRQWRIPEDALDETHPKEQ